MVGKKTIKLIDKNTGVLVDNSLTKNPEIHKDRWILSLDVKHSQIIIKCLKFYAQMSVGKLDIITEILPRRKKYNRDINNSLQLLKDKLFPELSVRPIPKEFQGIFQIDFNKGIKNAKGKVYLPFDSKYIPETSIIAFEVYKKIIKKTPPMKLVITEDEGYAINNCLEFYFRLAMGQFDFVFENIIPLKKWLKVKLDVFRDPDLDDLRTRMFPELPDLNSYHGIYSNKIPKEAQIACDIYDVIRHRLSWDRVGNPEKRDWSTMGGRNFDEPMNISGYPFPKIKKLTEK